MYKLISILVLLSLFFGCNKSTEIKSGNFHYISSPSNDLAEIIERGSLRAITTFSSTTYFLYKGKAMGFEYDLLTRLAKELDVELEIVIAKNEDELIEMLLSGKGDVIAYGFTILEGRKQHINFTNPLYKSNQVLVQRKPKNWRNLKLHQIKKSVITDPIDLINDTISVKKNSSYAARLANLSREIGGKIYIDTLDGALTTEDIFRKVSQGEIKYTVADQNIAYINASYFPNLDISTKISFSQQIAWGVQKDSENLVNEINKWINTFTKTSDYHAIYNKYYKYKRSYKSRIDSPLYSVNEGRISPYDDLIKKYAQQINWDWRLVASIAYQESRFEPASESWAGASGLMQIMPATAEELNIIDLTDPHESIRGGTHYLKELWLKNDDIKDSIQRIKFTLASYNCGYAHIKDAQRIAVMKNLNPIVWDENVEKTILDLSLPSYYNLPNIRYGYVRGTEPFNYVRQIFSRYERYKQFVEK